ncbi:MAG: uroporphyrinogen decarboxylase family protein [Sedimentisphaerales bacterium]
MPDISSYEIVKAAVEFQKPVRVPIKDLSHPESSDIVGVGFEPAVWHWHQAVDGAEECEDIFGCLRRRYDSGIGEVHRPALQSWDQLKNFSLPKIQLLKEQAEKQLALLPSGRFVFGDIGQFLSKIFEIRGFENALLDFGLYPEKVKELAKQLTDFAIRRTRMYAEIGGIHCISIYDDWGTQQSMLISPMQWRELFLDFYRQLFTVAHENNMFVYFHCCGAVGPIIPNLIEAGVNILNFDQPRLHGIKELSDKYAGKVTFCCPVDIQATLPKGDKKLIEQEVNELIKHLHRDGGFIAKIYRGWKNEGDVFDPAQYSKDIFGSICI